jgi:hypothetical protein
LIIVFENETELADVMKSKVMMLHQFRIRTLAKQLEELRASFAQSWTNSSAKIVLGRVAQPEGHTAAIAELLSAK